MQLMELRELLQQNFDFICCNVVTKGPEDSVCEAEVVREKDILFKLQFTCRQCFRVSESAERGLCECVPWGDTAVCYSTRLESLSGSCSFLGLFPCICVWKHSEPPPYH